MHLLLGREDAGADLDTLPAVPAPRALVPEAVGVGVDGPGLLEGLGRDHGAQEHVVGGHRVAVDGLDGVQVETASDGVAHVRAPTWTRWHRPAVGSGWHASGW